MQKSSCNRQGVLNSYEKQFYYWQRRIREEAYSLHESGDLPVLNSSPDFVFAEIPISKANSNTFFAPDAVIRKGTVSIEVSNTISDQLLAKLLGGLANA